jgi:hypothetical protein
MGWADSREILEGFGPLSSCREEAKIAQGETLGDRWMRNFRPSGAVRNFIS